MTRSEEWHKRATDLMPGGVSSPVRAFKSVGGTPRYLSHGDGARVTDVDGRTYVDFQMAFGPLILGHAHDGVVAAVADTATNGTVFGAPHALEVQLAERIVSAHPAADWVRFVTSGTEAVMSAVRLARAVTGRDVVVKFDGCYHGHADALLVKGGSGLATFGLGSSAGVPQDTVKHTAVLPLDDEAAVDAFFSEHGDRVACVIVEGVPANNGLLPQRAEWVRAVAEACKEHGALLVMDEVITGFRLGWGGAAEKYDVKPDLVTFGKVIGGGLPIAAYGGRADLKARVAPEGDVYQAGTLAGSPVALAAGLATLKALDEADDPYGHLAARTRGFADGLQDVLRDAEVPGRVVTEGSLLWLLLSEVEEAPRRVDAIPKDAAGNYRVLHRALLEAGVYLAPSAFEVGFVSLAHNPPALDEALDAFTEAVSACRGELKRA